VTILEDWRKWRSGGEGREKGRGGVKVRRDIVVYP
jgi:hypothetical protein